MYVDLSSCVALALSHDSFQPTGDSSLSKRGRFDKFAIQLPKNSWLISGGVLCYLWQEVGIKKTEKLLKFLISVVFTPSSQSEEFEGHSFFKILWKEMQFKALKYLRNHRHNDHAK